MEKSKIKKIIEKRIDKLETYLSIAGLVGVLLAVAVYFASCWLAVNLFYYEITEEKTTKEPYQHITGYVDTYICYTTTYGECYHASGCGSLWNSSYKTTVYEARQEGYYSCSKCEPNQKTSLALTETRYKDVTRRERITKYPKLELCVIGWLLLLVLYIPLNIVLNKEINLHRKKLLKLKE